MKLSLNRKLLWIEQYKDTCEAAIAGVKSIADCCIRSETVKRLIYTASVMSASPLKEDGIGYKSAMDESCWTPLNLSYTFSNDFTLVYLCSLALVSSLQNRESWARINVWSRGSVDHQDLFFTPTDLSLFSSLPHRYVGLNSKIKRI